MATATAAHSSSSSSTSTLRTRHPITHNAPKRQATAMHHNAPVQRQHLTAWQLACGEL
eukprot:NODE_21882_length_732_cov_3.786777.p1 GENE.NODE_21882_length_732_cov_3.786777~~NODE_21882_length_732_cov_3.786777.p1  ORF type:complete len:58 (+),score=7.38 NODE_21882_length_732_cov_3.786777:190-363(+)